MAPASEVFRKKQSFSNDSGSSGDDDNDYDDDSHSYIRIRIHTCMHTLRDIHPSLTSTNT